MKEHVVCGIGEVGSALAAILEADTYDPHKGLMAADTYRFLHIAFPYTETFVETVQQYKAAFRPEHVVIHSSVPLGTSETCNAIHSPIRGAHPKLEEGIRTFVKFFGGPDAEKAAQPFQERGIECFTFAHSRDAEAMKMWDLAQYGALIMLEKEIHGYCTQHGLDMNIVYTKANETYNAGYRKLGRENVVRPYLSHVDGKIGGHCVMPVTAMLQSETAQTILKKNEQL